MNRLLTLFIVRTHTGREPQGDEVPALLRRTPRRGIRPVVALTLVLTALGTALLTSPPAFAKSGIETVAAPFTTSPFTLESLSFSNPVDGYGLFSKFSGNSQTCVEYVGRTSDGGADFHDLVPAVELNCASEVLPSTLTFDAEGNGFLYGPSLSVTHDGGSSWTAQHPAGEVLAIVSVGRTLWKLESICSTSETRIGGDCPLLLEMSSDGGRAWAISSTFPTNVDVPARTASFFAAGQTLLIHANSHVDYVVVPPSVNLNGATDHADLWYSANSGATWVKRTAPCGIDAMFLSLSAAPSGALVGVCASGPSTGFQPKSTIRSTNEGRSWTTLNACDPTVTGAEAHCSSPLNDGYLGSIVAASDQAIFEVGGRSFLNATWDGGRTWAPVKPLLGGSDAGTAQVTFFNRLDGKVLVDANNEIATTSDGGRTWTRRIAKFDGRSYPTTEVNEG